MYMHVIDIDYSPVSNILLFYYGIVRTVWYACFYIIIWLLGNKVVYVIVITHYKCFIRYIQYF